MSDAHTTTSGVASLDNSLLAVAAVASALWVAAEFALRRGLAALLADPLGSVLGADMLAFGVGGVVLAGAIVVLGRRGGIAVADWDLEFSLRAVGAGLCGVLAYFVVYLGAAALYVSVLGGEPSASASALGVDGAPTWALAALVVVNGLLVPVLEEVAWRGVVQTALTEGYGAFAGVAVTAVLFVSKHLVVDLAAPPLRVASLVVAALVFGVLRHRYGTGSSMVAHVAANSLATLGLVLA